MRSVNLGRWSRRVERYFNIKGGGGLVDVDPSVRVVLPMIASGVEDRYLEGVESFAAAGQQNGVAGNLSAAMIRNPIGSNTVVTIEKISVWGAVTEGLLLLVAGSNPADLATTVNNFTRADPRNRTHGSAITTQDAPAANPSTGFLIIGDFQTNVATSIDLINGPNQEIVLLPQIACRIVGSTPNTTLLFTWFWRERPLEASELT